MFAQLSGQPKFEILPLNELEFFWKIVEAKIKFVKSDNGEINDAILYQNGREMKLKRLPDEKVIQVQPVVLEDYVGKYKLDGNTIITITRENDKLFGQEANQQKMQLWPTSQTDFVIKELNAKISFVRPANGKASMFKLNMNGRTAELPRIE